MADQHVIPDAMDAYDHYIARINDPDDHDADHDFMDPHREYMIAIGHKFDPDPIEYDAE